MYSVVFKDIAHGTTEMGFETFDEAMEYWQDYADTETCVFGQLIDDDADEVVWEFDEEKK